MGKAIDEAAELVARIGAAANLARNDAVLKARCILYMAAGGLMMAASEVSSRQERRGYTDIADLCWQTARELDGVSVARRGVAPWPGREEPDGGKSDGG